MILILILLWRHLLLLSFLQKKKFPSRVKDQQFHEKHKPELEGNDFLLGCIMSFRNTCPSGTMTYMCLDIRSQTKLFQLKWNHTGLRIVTGVLAGSHCIKHTESSLTEEIETGVVAKIPYFLNSKSSVEHVDFRLLDAPYRNIYTII